MIMRVLPDASILINYLVPPSHTNAVSTIFDLRLAGVRMGRERRLAESLTDLSGEAYDFILIDYQPNLSLVTTNALYAAGGVIVMVQAQDKAYLHLLLVFDSIQELQKYRRRESPDPAHPLPMLSDIVLTIKRRWRSSWQPWSNWKGNYEPRTSHAAQAF